MTTKTFSREVVTPVRFQLIKEKPSSPLTQWMNGLITDVSLDGVEITAPVSEAEAETMVRQYAIIKLSFQLPGTSKTIAATATIEYFVRGTAASDVTTITFGVSFVTIDYSAQDVIGAFIHQRVNGPALNKKHHFTDKKIPDVRREPLIPCFA